MLCFSIRKLPQPWQPNSETEGDGLVTPESGTYSLVSKFLILRDILSSLFRGFACVVQKDLVCREYFLPERLYEEQRQSLALGGHEVSVGSGYQWSWSAAGPQRRLPMKAAAPVNLTRQEDWRWELKFLAPAVFSLGMLLFAKGARMEWTLLYFSFKCELPESVRALPRYHHGRPVFVLNQFWDSHHSCI